MAGRYVSFPESHKMHQVVLFLQRGLSWPLVVRKKRSPRVRRHTRLPFRWALALLSALWLGAPPSVAAAAGRGSVTSMLELRRSHVVVQEWDLSCGAATLTTLLRYQHGLDITEREVAKRLIGREEYIADPSRVAMQQGFSLLDLKRVADKLDFEGIGFGQLELADLVASHRSSCPSICSATTISSFSAVCCATACYSPTRPSAIAPCQSSASSRRGSTMAISAG